MKADKADSVAKRMMKQEADSLAPDRPTVPRPPLFQALGRKDPPAVIVLEGRSYRCIDILKHDSWAATAAYTDDQGCRVACKFNRVHPLGIIPMKWLGHLLAEREQKIFRLMKDVEGFPRWAGPVSSDGCTLPNAVAHAWIDGQPFNPWLRVDEFFFPRLREMVVELHRHNVAYVDMSKWENILVGDDGQPYLIDFQIHYQLPRGWPLRWWLRWLQAADVFYLNRHWSRVRPEQLSPNDLSKNCPTIVSAAEAFGPPLRFLRRSILKLACVAEQKKTWHPAGGTTPPR